MGLWNVLDGCEDISYLRQRAVMVAMLADSSLGQPALQFASVERSSDHDRAVKQADAAACFAEVDRTS